MEEVSAIKDIKQLDRMKSYLRKTNVRDYLLLTMGVNIGLRISDMLKLQIKDVWDNGKPKDEFTIREGKTGKLRTITINESVRKALISCIDPKADPEEYLFASRKGDKAIQRQQAYRILNEAARVAGVTGKVGTHTLRKTFGYHAYTRGTDISLLMRVFGHSSQAVTLRYIGIEAEDIKNVYDDLNL